MLKKRKVWLIAGGVGLVMLLFAGAIVGQANSADAKMEAKLDEIFEQYDFKQAGRLVYTGTGYKVTSDTYQADVPTAADVDEIRTMIKDACKDCTVIRDGYLNMTHQYILETGNSYHSIAEIGVFQTTSPSAGGTGDDLHVTISVNRLTLSFWQRVKEWLPW